MAQTKHTKQHVYYMAINMQKGWSVTFVLHIVSYGPVN